MSRKFMSSYNFTLNSIKICFLLIHYFNSMLIIILQQETGSALVFAAFFSLFGEGMNGIFMVLSLLRSFILSFLRYDYISSSSNSYILNRLVLSSYSFCLLFGVGHNDCLLPKKIIGKCYNLLVVMLYYIYPQDLI